MASRRRTRLTREERRELLVDAAAKAFADRDPTDVTFEEIADGAGVSRALVYNYFGDRHGVVEAVAQRASARLRAAVTQALVSTPGLAEALHEVVRVHLRMARADPTTYRFAAGEPAPAPVDAVVSERLDEMEAVLGGGPEARLMGAGVVAAIFALVAHQTGPDGTGPDGAALVDDERAGDLIAAFLGGAYAGIGALGLPVRPTWAIPPSPAGAVTELSG